MDTITIKDFQKVDIRIGRVLEAGAEKARKVAKETMKEIYEVVGITNKLN
jgi:tRNA-binding EMAP/Myf-like protein